MKPTWSSTSASTVDAFYGYFVEGFRKAQSLRWGGGAGEGDSGEEMAGKAVMAV